MAHRIEIFSAGCPLCHAGEARVRELAGSSQEVVVLDLHLEDVAAAAAAHGIRVAPAILVDGRLLGCCNNTGPTTEELVAAGVGQPPA